MDNRLYNVYLSRSYLSNLKLYVMNGNYFTFKELTTTDTGLHNSVSCDSHLANLATLWNTLNYIRERFGAPIIVNSAYRTDAVNKQVGGSKRSLHKQGRAADIRPADSSLLDELWQLLTSEKDCYSELIKYETFIHIALKLWKYYYTLSRI